MSTIDTFLTVLKTAASPMDSSALITGVLIALGSFLLLGLGWGRLWNKQFPSGWFAFTVSGVFAGGLGLMAFVFTGAGGMVERVKLAQKEAPQSLAEEPAINRRIIGEVWAELQPLGKQNDLTSPDLGGTEVRVEDTESLKVLARKSAEVARRELPSVFPILNVVGFDGRSPEQIAAEVLDEETTGAGQQPITMNNRWTRAAIDKQAETVFESASKRAVVIATSARKVGKLGLIVLALSQLVAIPLLALGNIKTKF